MSESSPAETGPMSPGWTPSPARALRITLLYALVGTAWVACSGWVLHRLMNDHELEARLETYKGWLFVAVTSGLLWLALARYFRQLRRATQLLEESEQRSRFALEGTGQGAWDRNPQTNEVHYSARWKTMLGYEPQELADTHSEWETRVHPDDLPRALGELKRHLDGQTAAYRSEHRLRCKDGSYKWVLDQGKVMRRTSAGAPLRVLGTVSDITERKHAEAALQESEARYREVVQSANSVILRLDGEGKILFINDFAQQFFGYRAEELVGGNVVGTIVPPTDSLGADLRGLATEIVATPDLYATHENENLRRDGSRVWMSWTNRAFRDDAGHVREMVCVGHDITRRKQAELALQESEERLRFALEAACMGTFDWEMASGRLTWSPQHEQLWGLAPGQFKGDYEGFVRGIHPEDREGVQRELQRCLAARSPFYHEFRVVWPDASVHWIAGTGKFLLGPEGSPVRMHGIAREVTERRQAEQMKSLSVEVLQILNDPQPLRESARRILAAIKRETGLEAVGIRLRQGEDFPYLGADGFTQEFLDAENRLAVRTGNNEFCRDEQGRVLLECTCGLVLSGKTDPANALFTPGGSAWTNDARPFLKVPAEADLRLHPRNRCIHEGYQSVALIPIRVKEQVVGLLQLNDARQYCFTAEMVRFFEGIASAFGVALLRQQETEALRTSEANLRSLFDAIPELVFLMDTEGKLVAVNDTFATRMGRRVEECVGANAFEFLPAEVKERRQAWVAEVVRTGRSLTREDERSGSWLRHSLNPVLDASGKVERIVSFIVDLTERRRAEEAVRRQLELQDQLAKIATSVPGMIYSFRLGADGKACLPFCTPMIEELWGLRPEEVKEDFAPAFARIHPADVGHARESIAASAQSLQPWHDIFRVQHPRKGVVWLEGHSMPRREPDGSVLWHGFVQDVTERKQAEEAARESGERLRLAVEAARMGTWDRDLTTGQLHWSAQEEQLMGYEPGTFPGSQEAYVSLVHPDSVAVLEEAQQRVRTGDGIFQAELRFRLRDGRERWGLLCGQRIDNAEGRPLRILGVDLDITDRKRAEAELLYHQRLLEETGRIAQVGGWEFDAETGQGSWTAEVARIHGLSPELPTSVESGLSYYDEASRPLIERAVREAVAQAKPYDLKLRLVSADGVAKWVRTMGYPVVENGKVVKVRGALQDVTQQHLTEEALRRSERLQRTILDNIPDPAWLKDAEGRFQAVNQAWCQFVGLPPEEVVGRVDAAIFPPELAERLTAQDREAAASGMARHYEETMLSPKGQTRVFDTYKAPILDEAGRIGGTIGIARDITEQKRAEAALRDREQQLRLFVEHSPAAIAMLDLEMRYLVVSRRWMADYQLANQDILGRTHYEVFPEIPERWKAIHQRCLAGAVEKCEMDPFPRADGSLDWVRWEIRPWHTGGGEIGGVIIFSELISEQVKARAAIERSELEFRAMFEMASIGMGQTDPETGRWTRVNQQLCEITGYSASEMLGLTVSQVTHPDDRAQDVEHLQSLLHGEVPSYQLEKRYLRKDGTVAWVRVNVTAIRQAGERALRTMATIEDITARRRIDERLRQLSTAVEQSPASIVITDPKGLIEYVNPKFTETTGYTLGEAVGRNPRFLKSGTMPAAHYEGLWQTLLSQQIWRGEFHNRKKDGESFWEFASISAITDQQGVLTHFVAVKEDITERKRLEAFRQALLQLGRRLNGTREPVEAGRALLQTADQLWHWDAATLDLLTPDQQIVLPVLRVDQIGGERRELPEATPSLALTPRMRQVMLDGAKLIDQGAGDSAPGVALAFGDAARPSAAIMYVPIRREQDTVGLLSIHSYSPRAYTAEDLYTLQALADYCGGALDRIRSEQGLRTSEERYRSLVETTFDWVWEVDAEGRYTYASPKVEELLGYRPEEVLGKTLFDLMPPEEAERIGAIFRECAAARRLIVGIEHVCRHKNGSLVVLETSGAPVLDQKGRLLGYRGMDRDVTQRKHAEAALKASEERFRTLVESAPSGIFVQTKERFAYLNRSALRLFGLTSPEPLLGQPVLERFAPEAREQVRERIRRLNEERQAVAPAEEKCLRMDGTTFEAEVTAVPFAYDGSPGALVFFQDVTNRNRLEAQLRQAQKLEAVGQLAGGVAHDFNNILSAILMHLSLLAADRSLKPAQREDLGELVNEAKRGAALTRQLLMFSRRQVLQRAVLDLNSLLDNLLKMLRRLLGEHIEFSFRASPTAVWIEADPGMIEQVVMNLCVNARDAMANGGRLALSTATVEVDERHAALQAGARVGSMVCLSVRDSGQGMDEATLQRIFEPFFTTKEVGKGTGLGLATVHGIVQQHQGWVEVESAIGQGTTFRVYLPCARPPRMSSRASGRRPSWLAARKRCWWWRTSGSCGRR